MLLTLEQAIVLYMETLRRPSPEDYHVDVYVLAFRDSLIQRLEYCVDGFWKFMKAYFFTPAFQESARVFLLNQRHPVPA